MKALFVLIISLSSLCAFANENSGLLTQEEFMSLPPEKQVKYLKEFQRILSSMAQHSLYMGAKSQSENSRMPASTKNEPGIDDAVEEAANGNGSSSEPAPEGRKGVTIGAKKVAKPAESASSSASSETSSSVTPVPPKAPTLPTESAKPASAAEPTASAPAKTAKAAEPTASAPAKSAKTAEPTASAPAKNASPTETSASAPAKTASAPEKSPATSPKASSAPEQTASAPAKTASSADSSASAPVKTPSSQSPSTKTASRATPPEKASSTPESTPATSAPVATSTAENKKAEAPKESPEKAKKSEPAKEAADKGKETQAPAATADQPRQVFRCMYSGWVVEKDPCSPQVQFPEGFKLEGLDASKMNCAKGQTICNPLVFGMNLPKTCKKFSDCRDQATPLCVKTGAWPTVDCYHQSTLRHTQVAADLIKENRATFDNYGRQFDALCLPNNLKENPFLDPKNRKNKNVSAEAIRYDIEQTCRWARTQLKQVREAMDIPDSDREKWAEDKANAQKHGKKAEDVCKGRAYCKGYNKSSDSNSAQPENGGGSQ